MYIVWLEVSLTQDCQNLEVSLLVVRFYGLSGCRLAIAIRSRLISRNQMLSEIYTLF
ncbi:MAG: hypothetical protein AAFY50_19250 [Cyanobacteria bacterium J06648_1]